MNKVRLGSFLLLLLLLVSFFFAGTGTIDTTLRAASPSLCHPFGCDSLGRDLLSRVSYGVLVSLGISVSSALLSALLGCLLSILMARDGWVSVFTRTSVNTLKVLPPVVLALFFVSFGGNGAGKVILALSLTSGANIARTLSPKIRMLLGEEFVVALEATGIKRSRIWLRHILPMVYPYLREQAASILLTAILTESSLSYFGLGVKKMTPTLGAILSEGRTLVLSSPHVVFFPSLVLVLLGASALLVSRGLSELDSTSHR